MILTGGIVILNTAGQLPHLEQEREEVRNLLTEAKTFWLKLARKSKQLMCPIINNGHEMYEVHGDYRRLYRQCLFCEKQSRGWDLTRERPHLRRVK